MSMRGLTRRRRAGTGLGQGGVVLEGVFEVLEGGGEGQIEALLVDRENADEELELPEGGERLVAGICCLRM